MAVRRVRCGGRPVDVRCPGEVRGRGRMTGHPGSCARSWCRTRPGPRGTRRRRRLRPSGRPANLAVLAVLGAGGNSCRWQQRRWQQRSAHDAAHGTRPGQRARAGGGPAHGMGGTAPGERSLDTAQAVPRRLRNGRRPGAPSPARPPRMPGVTGRRCGRVLVGRLRIGTPE